MIFTETSLLGVFVIDPDIFEDERGFFGRSWSQKEFADRGLVSQYVESNISFNRKEGTLRGMHYQIAPHGQDKIVRCTAGAIYDVAIDLRPDSPTYKKWEGVELTQDNHQMLYVPDGLAHGFLTLAPNTEVSYDVSRVYAPESARGVRWNDPAFDVTWPAEPAIIIERDRTYPDFRD